MAYRIFALLLLIISTIDISFSQRKVPKHSVVTVDVKTAVQFDCPEEFGYYPHPDDCTQYYVCVFGGALLESCTGGLMYSQELQTCDWPRNVGCDGVNVAPAATAPSTSSNSRVKEEYTRTRYTPPPPPKPSAQVISRGQPRPQQIYHDEEINLKQQQLYQESEETLPEVQEEESDRQQRFYRGQPSTIGQVQRDRDGLRQSNAIAYHTGQKEKIGVISFGVHQAQAHQRTLTDYYLDTLTDNKLTLTRRKKRQIIPSLNIGAPRSWSNVRTSNRVPFATLQSRLPTGPDKSPEWSANNNRVTTNRNYPLYTFRQTDFIPLPRISYPSRYSSHKNVNINQYSSSSFIPTTPLYNSYRGTYYHLIPDNNRHRENEINSSTSNKKDSSSIHPSGFKSANYTHTDAITRAFDSVKFLAEKLPSKVQDSFNFQNTQNQSNIKHKASPFSLKSTTQSSVTKSVLNFVTDPKINNSTNGNIKKQKFELTTINPLKYRKNKYKEYDYYYYDDSVEEVLTTEPIIYRSRTPNKLPLFNVDSSSNYKQYQDLTNMTKFVEYKSRWPSNNGSKKNMIYSAKYKEEPSIGKASSTKKTIQDSPSTSLSISQRQTSSTESPTKPHKESLEQQSAFTLTTKAPTRSRTRQTTATILTRGKHRLQVTRHNSRNTVVKDMKRAESTTFGPEPASATSRTLVSTSQYSANSYSPYEQEYDDKVKYEYNSYNEPQPSAAPVSYRSRTPAPSYQSLAQDDIQSSKRSNAIQNDYVRNIYQEQGVPEYHDVTYDNAEEDHSSYRQSNRQQLRDDRKESNLIEDQPTPKSKHRISTTYSSSTSRYTTKKPVKTSSSSVSHKQNTASSSVSSNASKQSESLINLKQSQYVVPENTKAYTIPKKSQSRDLPQHTQDNLPLPSSKTNNNNPGRTPIPQNPIPDPISLDSIRTSQQIPITYRFITKKPPSKSTIHVSFRGTPSNRDIYHSQDTFISSPISTSTSLPSSTQNSLQSSTQNVNIPSIHPTTYAPSKLEINSFEPRTASPSNIQSRVKVEDSENPSFPSQNKKSRERSSTSRHQYQNNYPNRAIKEVKFIRKVFPVNPASINKELSPINIKNESVILQDLDEHFEISTSKITESPSQFHSKSTQRYLFKEKKKLSSSTNRAVTIPEKLQPEIESTTIPMETSSAITNTESNTNSARISSQEQLILDKISRYRNSSLINPSYISKTKTFNITVEVPPLKSLLSDQEQTKEEPDLPPTYKLKPFKLLSKSSKNKTDSSSITTTPRISRINPAFKFTMNAFRGTKGHNTKCNETTSIQICSDLKYLRTNNRGRGTGHYTSGNVVTNDVTVNTINVNRGTPPPRSRPTLKPSTSIVSKAQEFVDIYRYPPRRPDPIYPQPQPDKTAAKCRKDVCLLPDCNCGGKDIPGDIPPEQVPQIVLLTFDDSVNDLNKGLYQDLFEKGRVNPNGCPISATFYVSHEWTDYSQVQNLYSDGHEIASHTVSHSFGEQFSQKKWTREVAGQREILAAYGGVHLEDVRGMRAPFLSVGGNKMFKMLYDSNFTYDSSMPIYENKPPSWPYTLDYKLFHDCMIPPCPTRSYPGVWEVPMVMWQDLNGGRCSMGDACSNPSEPEGVRKMIMKNFMRHYTTNRAPFGLFYHAAWFTQPHHKEGFINLLDDILAMKDVWVLTNWQAVEWVRNPTPTSRLGSFKPFQCDYSDRPKRCNNPKVCNLWHKSGVRYMRTCQPCPEIYPWTGNSGIRSSRIDNDIED